MNQFLHLLVNPSSGLPSDLWVPSTKNAPPETSSQVSLTYYRKPNDNFRFSLGGFYRTFDGLLEYTNPTDLIQALVIDQSVVNFDVSDRSWEERITVGDGFAYGVELDLNGIVNNKWRYHLAYTYSRSFRRLPETSLFSDFFPYKYDRPHNLSFQLSRPLGPGVCQINFVFGNGVKWTLPEAQDPSQSNPRTIALRRNNRELGGFYHHLDIHYSLKKSIYRTDDLTFNFGIYNVYNEQNPFYGYLLQGNQAGQAPVKEISLFPILPQFNVKFEW